MQFLNIEKVTNMRLHCNDCCLKERKQSAQHISNSVPPKVALIIGPFFEKEDEMHQRISKFIGDLWWESNKYDYIAALKCSSESGQLSNFMCSLQTLNYARTRNYCGFIAIGKSALWQFDKDANFGRIAKTKTGSPVIYIANDPDKFDSDLFVQFCAAAFD
jgi:hypothetical protein